MHQVLQTAQFHITVIDDEGKSHEPKEWFVVPLDVVNVIIGKIMDGTIVGYTYNPDMECLERRIEKESDTNA